MFPMANKMFFSNYKDKIPNSMERKKSLFCDILTALYHSILYFEFQILKHTY